MHRDIAEYARARVPPRGRRNVLGLDFKDIPAVLECVRHVDCLARIAEGSPADSLAVELYDAAALHAVQG